MTSFCLIRRYKDEDQPAICNIVTDATMEQVGNFFWSALFSEILPQFAVVMIAVCYILIGIPLKYCIISIPIVIALMYLIVWTGHYLKANELCDDLRNIPNNYLQDNKTNFFVAEVFGKAGEAEMASLLNKMKKVEYDFYNSKEYEACSLNEAGLSRTVVGCVAVTRSLRHSSRAWIRRVAVKTEYRRRKIASHLLSEAIRFCENGNYEAVELITTECHAEAKQLYTNEGFKEAEVTHKAYFSIGASQVMYHMYKDLKKSSLIDEDETVAVSEDKV